MYSVVLMVALTGSAETTEFGCCGCSGYTACCGRVHHRCHGCSGCFCSGFVCSGCHGCHGCHGCFGCHGGLFNRHHRCCGCSGYVACCGAPVTCCGCTGAVPPPPPPPPAKMAGLAPATMIVTIPANATLTVDGNVTKSTSARRVFVTPDLETGSEYIYNLTATIMVDGQAVPQTQAVTVRGGSTTEVNFDFAATVASR